jgi:hypothetical protein
MKTFLRLPIIIATLFSAGVMQSNAQWAVFDSANFVENMMTKLESMTQTTESIQQTKHQYDSLMNLKAQLNLDNLMSQAMGTLGTRAGFVNQLTGQLNAIPNRLQGTFGGLLGFGGSGGSPWGNNNPIGGTMSTMLDNMMGRGQRQAQQVNNNLSRGVFDSNKAAGALSQMTATQSLLSEKDKAETLKTLNQQAAQAVDQQEGQAVQTQALLEGVSAQNEANTIMAADTLSRQEAQAEKRRNLRNRASGAAKTNMQSYLDN